MEMQSGTKYVKFIPLKYFLRKAAVKMNPYCKKSVKKQTNIFQKSIRTTASEIEAKTETKHSYKN